MPGPVRGRGAGTRSASRMPIRRPSSRLARRLAELRQPVPARHGRRRRDWAAVGGAVTAVTALVTAAAALVAIAVSYANANHQLELARQGQLTDRYSKAVEQLGAAGGDVRLGGIYALERLARDSSGDRSTIVEVLSAFVRDHVERPERTPPPTAGQPLATDLSGALTVLDRLGGADLRDARLGNADLHGANLTGAFLTGADPEGAYLVGAELDSGDLAGADLLGAYLTDAHLREAHLHAAYLGGANLTDADLSGADLSDTNLTRTDLSGANLTGAELSGANLTGTNLDGANLRGVRGMPAPQPSGVRPDAASRRPRAGPP
jgi:hypothetical protein